MENRSLPATQQRRKRLRAEGDVAHSAELSSAIIFLALLALAAASVNGAITWFEQFASWVWETETEKFSDVQTLQRFTTAVVVKLAVAFGSAAGLTLLVILGMNYLQSGRFTLKRKKGGLRVFRGLAHFFSFDNVSSFGISLLKITAIVTAVYLVAKPDLKAVFCFDQSWQQLTAREMLESLSTLIFKCCFVAAFVLLVLSGIDYFRQWIKYENRIRMTPDELRDEVREIETDPQIAARRREFYSQR